MYGSYYKYKLRIDKADWNYGIPKNRTLLRIRFSTSSSWLVAVRHIHCRRMLPSCSRCCCWSSLNHKDCRHRYTNRSSMYRYKKNHKHCYRYRLEQAAKWQMHRAKYCYIGRILKCHCSFCRRSWPARPLSANPNPWISYARNWCGSCNVHSSKRPYRPLPLPDSYTPTIRHKWKSANLRWYPMYNSAFWHYL